MNFIHIAVLLAWLTLANSYYLPRTKPPTRTPLKQPYFPPDLQVQGHKLQPDLRIPNEKFCKEMQLQPFRNYMILPWWHVHCERLLERQEKKIRSSKSLLPIYGKILRMVQKYKKKQELIEAVKNY